MMMLFMMMMFLIDDDDDDIYDRDIYLYNPYIDFFTLLVAKQHHVIQNRRTGIRRYTPSDLSSVFQFCPPFVNKTIILKI